MTEKPSRFTRGNDRIDRLVNDPEFAQDIRTARAGREKNRAEYRAVAVGRQLGELRRRAKLTQKDVARRMGVTQGRVSQIEKGTVYDTTVLRSYAEALNGHMYSIIEVGDRMIKVA